MRQWDGVGEGNDWRGVIVVIKVVVTVKSLEGKTESGGADLIIKG